jgi:tripartite-type tricarboxylate transporter receptor subunit TctC
MALVIRLVHCAAAALLLALTIGSGNALAQGKPLRMVVPFGAGSLGDVLGRQIADVLTKRINVPVLVEPRAGAGGLVGAQSVARADPDGNTIMLTSGAVASYHLLSANTDFDVRRDLEPLSLSVEGPFGIYVSNATPANSLPEFLAYAKARPGKLNYGSAGVGSTVHMQGELFLSAAGIDLVHVPYNATPALMTALATNDIQALVIDVSTARAFADAGRVRLLATGGQQRSSLYPAVPTAIEAGMPGYRTGFWYGFFAPPKTARAVLDSQSALLSAIVRDSEVTSKFQAQGYATTASSAEQLRQRVNEDIAALEKLVKAGKLTKQ